MKAHFYDLDNTIWDIDRKAWIIEKDYPNIPLLRLTESDFNLIKSGIFKCHNNRIYFNGIEYWISSEMFDQIKDIVYKKGIDISQLGVSLQEYTDEQIISNLKFQILGNNLKNIAPGDALYVLSAKSIKDKHEGLFTILEDELQKEKLTVTDYYFINESVYSHNAYECSFKKATIALQHLVGYRIVDNKFTHEKITQYSSISFYDTKQLYIDTMKDIQLVFEKIYNKTTDENLKTTILEVITSGLNIEVVQITTNKLNNFLRNQVKLVVPKKVMSFESFKFKMK